MNIKWILAALGIFLSSLASADNADCVREALRLSFNDYGAMRLCTRGGTAETAACAELALENGFSHDGAIYVCVQGGSPSTIEDCVKPAKENLNFSTSGAAGLCTKGGDASRYACASMASEIRSRRNSRFNVLGLMRLCSRGGTEETAKCAEDAMTLGTSIDGAIMLCGLGGDRDRSRCVERVMDENSLNVTRAIHVCHVDWRETLADPRWWIRF